MNPTQSSIQNSRLRTNHLEATLSVCMSDCHEQVLIQIPIDVCQKRVASQDGEQTPWFRRRRYARAAEGALRRLRGLAGAVWRAQ